MIRNTVSTGWWRTHAGVRVRSTVAAAGVVAVALCLGMLAAWWLLQRALINAAVAAVTTRSVELADLVHDGGHQALDLERQPAFGEVIQILDGRGALVDAAPASARQLRLGFRSPTAGNPTTTTVPALPQSRADEPYILVARVATDGPHGPAVVVVVGRSVAGLAETVGTMGELTLGGLPLLVLVTAGATYWFTGRALRPVEQIRQRVQDISAQRLDERVPVPPVRDEIGRLAETMNAMLASLEASQESQRRFVADAGHELRSPLATVAVALDVARRHTTSAPGDELGGLLDDLAAENARMSRLVEDLLLLARADEHGLRLRTVDVDVDELLLAEARRLRSVSALHILVSCRAARVHGDPARLSQVLRNLADNAARHAAGTVRLSLHIDGPTAIVRVDDDGPGVPPEDRQRVFDRFVRLDAARDRDVGGSGLGLSIVREIVLGHGGHVRVEASDLGGASLVVLLPLDGARSEPRDCTRSRDEGQPSPVSSR